MPDFAQSGPITTLHDLDTVCGDRLRETLRRAVRQYPIGLVLPLTAADMRAAPFQNIMSQLATADYID